MQSEIHKPKTFIVDLQPIGRRVEVEQGTNLLEAAQRAGIDLVASCGGIGICGTCLVRVVQGKVTPVTLTEEEALDAARRQEGFRLACQTEPLSDVRLDIPPESLTAVQQMQVEGREGQVALSPAVRTVDLALEPPHIDDLRSDMARVDEELARQGYGPLTGSLALLGQLSHFLRQADWKARLAILPVNGVSELVAVLPAGAAALGLAMDLGSTKLALYLVDLATGATLARSGVMNPQIAYGEDVVNRIAFANRDPENRKVLQSRLVETINQAAAAFCAELNLSPEQIVDVTAVGNTAIHHLFCGLPVEQLGSAPYVPVVSEPLYFFASEIGLSAASGAKVFMPSNIAGYVGADHVSALLATQSYAAHRTTLVVDIGTNTEVSLTYHGQVFS
ncbi:MAG TPA: 2Fe-2S iron-sulfur cluster-binding protein, partial [Anaerolineaceae bacterium]